MENLRLVLPDGVEIPATPSTVTINVIDELLVSRVTSRPLTIDEIRQRGIEFDPESYQAFEFTLAFTTASGVVPIDMPVLVPVRNDLPMIELPMRDPVGEGIPELRDLGISAFPLMLKLVGGGKGTGPPIPGILVIPGNVAFLNQYFSAFLIVSNGAPDGTPLVVRDLQARMHLPAGPDGVVGELLRDPPYAQGDAEYDNPLRLARTGTGRAAVLPVLTAGGGTTILPQTSGSAEFLVEGVREGAHIVEVELRGMLDGLPGGPVAVEGFVRGGVVVRDPDFNLTFVHPDTVRAGQLYDLVVQVQNTSPVAANLVRITLDPRNMSGVRLPSGSAASHEIETIAAGATGTFTFRLEAMRTGRVTASSLDIDGGDDIVSGRRLSLRVGVGEDGVVLSPDTLLLPAAASTLRERAGNDDLTFRAVALLGEAHSVATAPRGSLPAGIARITSSTVVERARVLASAGQRLELSYRLGANGVPEPLPDSLLRSLEDLSFDFLGVRSPDSGWDALYRRSRQARLYGQALADIVAREASSLGVADLLALQRHWTDEESYRSGHISVMTQASSGSVPVVVTLSDALGRSLGGSLDPPAGQFNIPGADLLHFAPSTLGTGQFALATQLQSASYRATLSATASGTFDLGIVVPGQGGILQHVTFRNLSVSAGESLLVSISTGVAVPVTLQRGSTTIAPTAVEAIPAKPLGVVGVVQTAGTDVDPFGRVLGVLFNQDVDRATAENRTAYAVDTATVSLAPPPAAAAPIATARAIRQYGNRVVLVGLAAPVGPFVPRRIDISGVKALPGTAMLVDADRRIVPDPERGVGGMVSGRVRSADGTPVSGAEITYLQYLRGELFPFCMPHVISETVADANGGYVLDFVIRDAPGCEAHPFQVRARDPVSGESETLETDVRADGERLVLDFALLGRGTVRGTVRTPSGAVVKGASVRLVSDTDADEQVTVTDQHGTYVFKGVAVGAIGIEGVVFSGPQRGQARVSSTVAARGVTTVVDLTLGILSDGAVQGTVRAQDGSAPVRLPVYLATPSGLLLDRTDTDESGAFRFERVQQGEHLIRAINVAARLSGDARLTILPIHTGATPAHVLILLNGTGRIEGTVTRREGSERVPVANAIVRGGFNSVVADALGRYALEGVPVGTHEIVATDPRSEALALEQARVPVTILHAGQVATGIDLVIEPLGTISGRVFDPDGNPVGGQTVNLVFGGGTPGGIELYRVRSTQADGDGRYRFTGVEFGATPVTAFRGRDTANATAYTSRLAPDAVVDLHMARPLGRVSGRVVDEQGMGVAAEVRLMARVPNAAGLLRYTDAGSIVSDPTRGFTFTQVFPGPFTIVAASFFSPGGVSATASGVLTIDAPTADGITLVLGPNTDRLRGCLLAPDGTRLTPILDPQGVPLEMPVIISSPRLRDQLRRDTHNPEPEGIRVDGSSGCYVSTIPLPEDQYTIQFTDLRQGSPTYGRTGEARAEVRDGGDTIQDVRLLGLGRLHVEVVDGGGALVPGVSVKVRRTSYPNDGADRLVLTPTGTTTATFDGLTEGPVSVSAIVSTDPTVDVGGRNELRGFAGRAGGSIVRDGEVVVRVVVDAAGIVSGRVVRSDATTPASFAQITLSKPGENDAFDVTDASGTFRFDGVKPGAYTLRAMDPTTGRRAKVSGAIATDGQHAVHELRLTALGTVQGVVFSETGDEPVALADVTLRVEGSEAARRVTTASGGAFTFPSVPSGEFSVVAVSPLNMSGRAEGIVEREGHVVDVAVHLEGSGTVVGTVFDAHGQPVPLADITLLDVAGRLRRVQAGPAGQYAVSPVPLGGFVVKARPAGALTPGDGGAAPGSVDVRGETRRVDVHLQGTIAVGVTVAGTIGASPTVVSLTSDGVFGGLAAPTAVTQGVHLFQGVPRAALTVTAKQVSPTGLVRSASRSLDTSMLPPAGGRLSPDVTLTLEDVGSIRGVVERPGGALVTGARVTLAAGAVHVFTVSDTDGRFEFLGVPLQANVRVDVLTADGDGASFSGVMGADGILRSTAGESIETLSLTLDIAPPTVISVSPVAFSTGVLTTSPVVVTFSEPIRLSSLRTCTAQPGSADPTIRLVETVTTFDPRDPDDACDDSNVVRTTVTLSPDGLRATLTPVQPLRSVVQHTVAISGGAPDALGRLVGGIEDLFGRSMAGSFASSFVTRDDIPPQVVLVSPAPGALDTPTDSLVRITLSEPIDPASVTAGVVVSTLAGPVPGRRDIILGGTVIVFTPTLPDGTRAFLSENTAYTVTLVGLRDVSGNTLAAAVQSAFRTRDTIAPSVESISAPPNAREGSTVRIVVVAPDVDVASVELFVNGALAAVRSTAATPGTYQFDVTMPGTNVAVAARAVDASGNIGPLSPAVTVALLADPYIHAVLPESAEQATTVPFTLAGTRTTFQQGVSSVSFGAGIAVSDVVVTSPTTLSGRMIVAGDAPVGLRVVTVTTGTEIARLEGASFLVTPATARLDAISPASLPQATTSSLTIVGSGTRFTSGTATVSLGAGVSVTNVIPISNTVLWVYATVAPTAAVGTRNVAVTSNGQTLTLQGGFRVSKGFPRMESFSPVRGAQGATLPIQVQAVLTDFVAHPPTMNFGEGIAVGAIAVTSPTTFTVPVTIARDAVIGPRDVEMQYTDADGTSASVFAGGFTVDPRTSPSLVGVSPESAAADETVPVSITGQFTNFTQGQTTVSMGDGITISEVTVASATRLTATAAIASSATPGPRTVVVSTATEVAQLPSGFVVREPGTVSLAEAVTAVFSVRNGALPGPSLPAGTSEAVTSIMSVRNGVPPTSTPGVNEAVSSIVSVSNAGIGGGSGITEAVSAIVSIRNGSLPLPELPAGTNEAVSTTVSLRNGQMPGPQLPTGANEAVSTTVSLRNGLPPTELTAGQREAVTATVAVRNTPTLLMTAQTADVAQDGPPAGATASTPRLAIATRDGGVVVAGQTLRLTALLSDATNVRSVRFELNGLSLGDVTTAPWSLTFVVPNSPAALRLRVVAQLQDGDIVVSDEAIVGVTATRGIRLTGVVLDEDGRPRANTPVAARVQGLAAEGFDVPQVEHLPDLAGLAVDRRAVLTSPAMRNPDGVLGLDPLGLAMEPHYAARLIGRLRVPVTGVYRIKLAAYAGARVSIEGASVAEVSGADGAPGAASREVLLPAGAVPIEIAFFDDYGPASLVLTWVRPDGIEESIEPHMVMADLPWLTAVTDADGRFEIADVPAQLAAVQVVVVEQGVEGESELQPVPTPSLESGVVELAPIRVRPARMP